MLQDVRFQRLGVRRMRVVVPYDVALDARGLARYAPVLDLARARRVRVLQHRAPGVPRTPARGARRAGPAGVDGHVQAFRRFAKRPRIFGLHNYLDVNNFGNTSIARLKGATGRGAKVWLTETGGIVRFAHTRPYDERRAARATRHLFRLAAQARVARVYLYMWTGAPLGSRWDSGIVAASGRPRPALNEIERLLGRPRTRLPRIPRIAPFPTPAPRKRRRQAIRGIQGAFLHTRVMTAELLVLDGRPWPGPRPVPRRGLLVQAKPPRPSLSSTTTGPGDRT